MDQSTDVIFTGGSAGGLTAYLQVRAPKSNFKATTV